jgi:disease resistance protein RPM1
VMLEIIVSKSIEENFTSLIGEQHTLVPQEKIRRLSVHSGCVKDIATSKMLSHVRSLSIFANGKILQFDWMKLMRILDLEGHECLSSRDLKSVCRLFQLEYLSLRRTRVMELPSKIAKLEKLRDSRYKGYRYKEFASRHYQPSNFGQLTCGERILQSQWVMADF